MTLHDSVRDRLRAIEALLRGNGALAGDGAGQQRLRQR